MNGCAVFGSDIGYCNIAKLEAEAPVIVDARKKLEDQQVRIEEMRKLENQEALRKELDSAIELEKKLNAEIKEKVNMAMGTVRKKNNLVAIIDARAVYDGGKDVTDEVLTELKK